MQVCVRLGDGLGGTTIVEVITHLAGMRSRNSFGWYELLGKGLVGVLCIETKGVLNRISAGKGHSVFVVDGRLCCLCLEALRDRRLREGKGRGGGGSQGRWR